MRYRPMPNNPNRRKPLTSCTIRLMDLLTRETPSTPKSKPRVIEPIASDQTPEDWLNG